MFRESEIPREIPIRLCSRPLCQNQSSFPRFSQIKRRRRRRLLLVPESILIIVFASPFLHTYHNLYHDDNQCLLND